MVEVGRVKGMRDYDFEDMALRNEIVSKVREIYERFGFRMMETPALEKYEILVGKEAGAGEEIKKEIYSFEDNKGRRLGLRFDLTVPLMRFLGMNTNISLPFKRQQYGRVWRYEDTKKGRYREFYQYDIDIVGSKSMKADAECIAAAIEALKAIGVGKFIVKINNRKLTEGILLSLGIKSDLENIMRVIDKIPKFKKEEILKELQSYGVEKNKGNELIDKLKFEGSVEEANEYIASTFSQNEKLSQGLKDLKKLFKYLEIMNVKEYCRVNLSIVRGLGYYTGNVFETFVEGEEDIGSICSGGRYDGAGKFANKDLPSVGISLGIERILDILKKKKKITNSLEYFVVSPSKEFETKVVEIANILRSKGYQAEYDLMGRNFSNNLKYASKKGYKYVVIVGEREIKENKVLIKDMRTGKEVLKPLDEL